MVQQQTIGNMTRAELEQMIKQTAERKLRELLQEDHILALLDDEPANPRTIDEVLESVKRNRWTPPPDSPSVVEMIREDRDR